MSKIPFKLHSLNFAIVLAVLAFLHLSSPTLIKAEDATKPTSDWIKAIFKYKTQDLPNALNDLVSLRYYKQLSDSKVNILKDAWNQKNLREHQWNPEIIRSIRIRLLMAEILGKFDRSNHQEYYNYVISQVNNEAVDIRAVAALSLGFVGTNDDIETLVSILLNDEVAPAIQAGFGLIALGTDEAIVRLEESIKILAQSDEGENAEVVRVIGTTLDSMKYRKRTE